MSELEKAIANITVEELISLEYGEERLLNNKYTLYHYYEDDIITINETEEWTEILQVMYNKDKVIFENLI